MPREEAKKITDQVKEAVRELIGVNVYKNFEIQACGSYRRGKTTCGDVDILITRKDTIPDESLLEKIIKKLENHLLVAHLGKPKKSIHGS